MEEQQGKVCNKCKQWKPLEEFNKNKKRKDGRQYECRECQKEHKKQWSKNNKEHIKEYEKQWRENNPEYYKIYFNSEQQKQYRENNKEYKKIYDKQWYANNKENRGEQIKQWYENNKEHKKEYDKQRYQDNTENNLQYISNIVESIRPIFKEFNLPVYGYIYKFENIKTGHVYIGQTILPLKERYGSNAIKSWIKERKEKQSQKFLEELIEEDIIATELFDIACCEYHLNAVEAYWINHYDSYNNGYNNTQGNHKTNDGIEEFNKILEENGLKFIDGKLIENNK